MKKNIILIIISISLTIIFLFWYFYSRDQKIIKGVTKEDFSQIESIGQKIAEIYKSSHNTTKLKSPDCQDFLEKTKNYVIGKFSIKDPALLHHVEKNLYEKLKKLSKEKTAESVIKKYNPKTNNYLVLWCARMIFNLDTLTPHSKLLIGQYLINKSDSNKEISKVYDWIITIVLNNRADQELRANAVDILMLSNNSKYIKIARENLEALRRRDDKPDSKTRILDERENILMEKIRNPSSLERQPQNRVHRNRRYMDEDIQVQAVLLEQLQQIKKQRENIKKFTSPRSIYDDGQNVHDHTLNKSVVETAKGFSKVGSGIADGISLDATLLENLSDVDKEKINKSLERIFIDSTVLENGVTLASTFKGVINHIKNQSNVENKKELNNRLIQELLEMSGSCFTGHLSRLTNIVQGFENNPVGMKIDITQEVYAALSHHLNTELQLQENEKIMEDLTDGNEDTFINFVKTLTRNKLDNFYKEYSLVANKEKINESIINAVNKYAKNANVKSVKDL